ncbi:MAG: RrF2 family transcriptional regulator [Planctomycetota bacterium]|jgi:Rrf2 family protein
MVPQKTQYALRAVFELAKRYGQGPVKISDAAEAQAIPPRFLEVILNQLKRAAFLESRRGREGGYLLTRRPAELSVGEVMRSMQGDMSPVDCVADGSKSRCPLHGDCVFLPMWRRAGKAAADVYDSTTFQDLIEEESKRSREYIPGYSI